MYGMLTGPLEKNGKAHTFGVPTVKTNKSFRWIAFVNELMISKFKEK